MPTALIEYVQATSFFNERISESHFGTSFEARALTLLNSSPTAEVLSRLPGGFLRYPGGSQTEAFFNPADPDNPRPIGIFLNRATTFEPVSNFISFVSTTEMQAVFVIPTYRYFDKNNAQNFFLTSSAEREIREFVSDILSGVYGEVAVAAFEIGNEWFNARQLFSASQNPEGWTAAQFGALQGRISQIVSDTIEQSNSANTPAVWIQTGQSGDSDIDNSGIRDSQEILDALTPAMLDGIDGIIDHFYQPTRYVTLLDNLRSPWVSENRIDGLISDGWNLSGRDALDIIASEWNVRAARNGDNLGGDANITGLERLPLFIGLFSSMIASGVDIGMVYTAQSIGVDGGAGALSVRGETTLTPTGLLFRMMGNSLPGTRLADANGDGAFNSEDFIFQDRLGNDVGANFTFSGENRIVAYYAACIDGNVSLSISGFSNLLSLGYHVSGSVIGAASGMNPVDAAVDGVVSVLPYSTLDGDVANDGVLQIQLNPFEVIEIVFTYGQGVRISGDDQSIVNDSIDGSMWSDTLFGAAGNDLLTGRSGSDRLFGGNGNDTVYGGDGSDVIRGGDDEADGADAIYGGAGNDNIGGGAGNDWLLGGDGNDTIYGGAGFDMVSFIGSTCGVTVNLVTGLARAGTESDVLYNLERVTGSIHGDLIIGNGTANELRGLGGDDWFIASGGQDTINGGAGRDMISYQNSVASVVVNLGTGRGSGGLAMGDIYIDVEGVTGSSFSDAFYGSAGDDQFRGLGGNDTFMGSFGRDRYDGGAGQDMASYANATAGVTASLALGRGSRGDAAGDLYTEIENLTGSSFADNLSGDNGRNLLLGFGGDDFIFGNGDNDRMTGGGGNDTINGGAGYDYAIFSGLRSHYNVSTDGGITTVSHTGGSRLDGTDRLIAVEVLVFSDDTVFI